MLAAVESKLGGFAIRERNLFCQADPAGQPIGDRHRRSVGAEVVSAQLPVPSVESLGVFARHGAGCVGSRVVSGPSPAL